MAEQLPGSQEKIQINKQSNSTPKWTKKTREQKNSIENQQNVKLIIKMINKIGKPLARLTKKGE